MEGSGNKGEWVPMNTPCGSSNFQSLSPMTIFNGVDISEFTVCKGFYTDPLNIGSCTVNFDIPNESSSSVALPDPACIASNSVVAVSCSSVESMRYQPCQVNFTPFRRSYNITSSNLNCLLF